MDLLNRVVYDLKDGIVIEGLRLLCEMVIVRQLGEYPGLLAPCGERLTCLAIIGRPDGLWK